LDFLKKSTTSIPFVFGELYKYQEEGVSEGLTNIENEKIVRRGYNKIASKYNDIRNRFTNNIELEYFVKLLPEEARILDAGCGAGVPVAKFLVERGFSVTGIDISTKMLEIARKQVPEAKFIEGDMTKFSWPDESFHGIVSLYAIIHVPREKHEQVFQNFYRLLRPNGILFLCTGARAHLEGVKMFWSHPSPEKSLSWLRNAGFEIIRDEILVRGGEKQYWIFARKKRARV